MERPLITLTTDFGSADSYVATIKGVILGICPEATLVDISHKIRPQAIRQAAYVLSTATPYFPPDTVHLVVVDPGVGSDRRPIIAKTHHGTYVAPDNGVLGMSLANAPAYQIVHLTNPQFRLAETSATFHGRDIFAPAAAYLACGVRPADMGQPITTLVHLPSVQPTVQADGSLKGQVLHIDRFGNLITTFVPSMLNPDISIQVEGEWIQGLSTSFSDVPKGELVAYIGSSNRLEIALCEANAAERLGLDIGDVVTIVMPSSNMT